MVGVSLSGIEEKRKCKKLNNMLKFVLTVTPLSLHFRHKNESMPYSTVNCCVTLSWTTLECFLKPLKLLRLSRAR